jgi:hypothetical protein
MLTSLPHRAIVLSLALATLTSCKLLDKKSGGDPGGASTGASAEGGATQTTSASEPPLPTTFELVAVGKRSGAKLVWLKLLGDRVWLSGMGLDAYAEGDGALATAPDLTQGLKQKQGESYEYTGAGDSLLFALRTIPDSPKSDDPPTVWVRDGKAPWSSGSKLPHFHGMHNWLIQCGFTRWKDGALFVSSQVASGVNMALFAPNAPGTDFQTISPKGEIKDLAIDLPKEVMAWAADSDGSTLALVGYRAKNLKATGISVFRGNEKGPLAETPIIDDPGTQDPKALFSIVVREQGKAALAYINQQPYGAAPLDKLATTVFVIGDKAKEPKKLVFAPAGKGAVVAAGYVGSAVYATVKHNEQFQLSRAADGAEPAPVKLPSLAKAASGFRVAKDAEAGLTCEATDLFARKNDLWVQALCSGQGMKVPAVFRLGHAQEPIALP